jgi:hypothetical protein
MILGLVSAAWADPAALRAPVRGVAGVVGFHE